jgi:FkbH-like protein
MNPEMKTFSELKRNLKKDTAGLNTIKVALVGDTATQFLALALKGAGFDAGYNVNLFEADFDQIEAQLMDTSSELYHFSPEIIIIFHSAHKLLNKYNKLLPEKQHTLAESRMELVSSIHQAVTSNLKAKIIYYNYQEIDDSIYGSYANKVSSSFIYQTRKLNFMLMEFAEKCADFFVCDLSIVQSRNGKAHLFHPSVYVNSEMVLNIDSLPEIATRTFNIIDTLKGKFKKCLILDLDNTTWGGIIGDDGIENIQVGALGIGKAFTELQHWAKKLKNRGIILAVCSKNTESIAKEPFEKHPDMVLRLEDIAVFLANWENKADNIRRIQSILNIGFDSMVFLDDNPFERNLVRENVPGVTVPELPEDPAEYLEYLYTLNLFETASFSNADLERTKQYQIEAQRAVVQKSFTNEDDFLKSLSMESLVEPFNKFNTPRVAQLSQRSNQFNLRTVRYTEADIEALGSDQRYHTFSFTLDDKFGDNGLICVIILEEKDKDTLFIDTWFMSCRVLKRGMENFVLNTISTYAKNRNFTWLTGEYIPTLKNEMVKDHYKNLGFESKNGFWALDLENYQDRKTFIKNKN